MTVSSESSDFDELAGLVKASFPDLTCLRCGNDRFYLLTDPDRPGMPADGGRPVAVLTLACTRCGFLENHLAEALRHSAKPIAHD